MKSLDTILLNNPTDSEALGVKADTYIYQGEYIKAEDTAKECLLIDNVNIDALEALCDVKRYMKDWKGLKEISRLGIEAAGDDNFHIRRFTEMHIVALLYLREYEEAKKDVENLPGNGIQEQRKLAFKTLVKVCSGDTEDALSIVNRVLAEEKVIGAARAILKAINNCLAISYNESIQKYDLNKHEQDYLQNIDIEELLDLCRMTLSPQVVTKL